MNHALNLKYLVLVATMLCSSIAQTQDMCTDANGRPDTPCYRYLCNNVFGDGSIFSDSCAIECDDENAPKWATNSVGLHLNSSDLPSTLSAETWQGTVRKAATTWSEAAGANLNFIVSTDGERVFNVADGQSNLFFVTDRDEFIRLVGADNIGLLAATATIYDRASCSREIYDADIVFNAATTIVDWNVNNAGCTSEPCLSLEPIVLHELGHVLGIGHPCYEADCKSWTIMGANSSDRDPETLRAIDVAVVAQLYPGDSGGFGAPCSVGCDDGFVCQSEDGTQYCTRDCDDNADCPIGFTCDVGTTGRCLFTTIQRPNIGESCQQAPHVCADGAVCLGNANEALCYRRCEPDSGTCPFGFACTTIEDGVSACTARGEVGSSCDTENICHDGLRCITVEGQAEGVCRSICDPETSSPCREDENCIYVTEGCASNPSICGSEACLPSGFCDNSAFCFPGGAARAGEACVDSLDCDANLTCIYFSEEIGECRQRCHGGDTCPNESQTCFLISDNNDENVVLDSYCDPIIDQNGADPSIVCDLNVGHLDCPADQICDTETERCIDGIRDGGAFGTACRSQDDCESGVCLDGVCTRFCSDGCPAGYTCGVNRLCQPEDCQSQDDVCAVGYICEEISPDRYSCVIEPVTEDDDEDETRRSGCSCQKTSPVTSLVWLSLCILFRYRRRVIAS